MISPALDPGSTTVEVWLKIDNKSGALKVGTPAKVTVTGRTVANALKIPTSAVLTAQDGSKTVMVIGSDGAAHSKPVKLGIQDGEDVQVLSGLATPTTSSPSDPMDSMKAQKSKSVRPQTKTRAATPTTRSPRPEARTNEPARLRPVRRGAAFLARPLHAHHLLLCHRAHHRRHLHGDQGAHLRLP